MSEWDGSDRRNESWHVKKELTWGHIVTTIMLAAGMITVYTDMSSSIEHNRQEIQHVKEINELQTQNFKKAVTDVNDKFEKIDKKLDKLIDYRLSK